MSGDRPYAPEATPPVGPPWTLRTRVLSGFAWSFSTSIVVQVSRVAFAVALARFLTPREYGLAAMALVFSALVFAFSDLSLGVGLVQRAEITEEDRSTVFWTSAAMGVLLTVAGIAVSGPLASFYGEPDVQPLFAVLSFSFLIGSLGATHAALLHRTMNFRAIGIRVTTSTLVGGAVGVGLAAAGFGAWALIIQQLCVAVITTTLLWISIPWKPRFVFSAASLRDLGSFGGKILGVRVADYVRLNADKLLIGRVLGSAAVGTYALAFNVLLAPVTRFLIAVTDTLFPALSRIQGERARLASAWIRVTRIVAAAFVPALLGLAVVAPDFVRVVLGERWSDVAPLLQIMALGIVALAVSTVSDEVLKALGRAGTLLRFYVAETVLLLGGVIVGLQWGVVGVASALAIVIVPTRTFYVWLTGRVVGVSLGQFLSALSGVGAAAVVLVLAVEAVRLALMQTPAPISVRLVAAIGVGVAVYVPIVFWRVPEMRAELGRIVRERRAARITAPSAADG